MYLGSLGPANPCKFDRINSIKSTFNYGNIKDERIDEAFLAITAAYLDEPKRRQMMKEVVPYIVDQCYIIVPPTGYYYYMWHPWVKGYHGEISGGYISSVLDFPKYIWLDLELKEEMTGQR